MLCSKSSSCFGLVVFAACLLAVAPTRAHEVRPALLNLERVDEFTWQASFKQPQINGRYLSLSVETNCDAGEISPVVGIDALEERFELDCSDGALAQLAIIGLDRTLTDALVRVIDLDRGVSTYLLNGRHPVVELYASGAPVPAYFVLGIEHMLLGIDHLLFVVILLYLVRNWQRLILVISSFTLAHSVTLAVSSLGLVYVPQAPVEALIALSIVLLATEVLRSEESSFSRSPWLLAALFGLLHGFGFAGALADLGLPKGNQIPALLLFNVGIEVAQLFVVIATLFSLRLVWRVVFLQRPMTVFSTAPAIAAGILASYWFVERTVAVFS